MCIWSIINNSNEHIYSQHTDLADILGIYLHSLGITLFTCYIPPSLTASQNEELEFHLTNILDIALLKHPDYHLIICGDFNRFKMHPIASQFDVTPLVSVATRASAILDQIFVSTSIAHHFQSPDIGPPIATSDHASIFLRPLRAKLSQAPTRYKVAYDFRRSHIADFLLKIDTVNWTPFYRSSEDLDVKLQIFYQHLHGALKSIPRHIVPVSPRDKPWLSAITKHLIHERWAAYRQRDFQRYSYLKEKVKAEIINAKKIWAAKISSSRGSPWNIFNLISGKSTAQNSAISPLIDSLISKDPSANPADAINSQLAKNFTAPTPPVLLEDDDWCPVISPNEVEKALNNLNDRKAAGPDSIPPKILRLSSSTICNPLAHIFNLIIIHRQFPQRWKHAHVVPIPKKRNPSISDLRPISLLSICSKVFEKLLFRKTQRWFYENYGIHQYGFRPLSSTTSALIHAQDLLTLHVDNLSNVAVSLIAFDFSKAFDSIPHNRLINSLLNTGFPKGLILLPSSYLCQRTQSVVLPTHVSSHVQVTSGVPQGGVISPPLFCVYIRTLSNFSTTTLIKYADDTSAITPHLSTNNIVSDINAIIARIDSDSSELGFKLNTTKTKMICIRRSQSPLLGITLNEDITLLGVIFSADKKWSKHIENCISKAAKSLYPLRRLRHIIDTKSLLKIYFSNIRSILEYAGPLFIGLNQLDVARLERFQRRCLRIIFYPEGIPSDIPSLTSRRISQAKKLYNAAHNSPDHPLHAFIPAVLQRSSMFAQPPSRSTFRLNSFIPRTTMLLNDDRLNTLS